MNNVTEPLTDLQRRNLAAIRIKRAQMKNQFGNRIQIVDTDEQVLSHTDPIAIPASAIMTDKQIVIRMDNIIEHPDGSRRLVADKHNQPLADNLEDVTDALEYTATLMEEQTKRSQRKVADKPAEFVVPAGYKLVKIEDDADVAEEPAAVTSAFNDIGIAIPKDSRISDKEALDELLA